MIKEKFQCLLGCLPFISGSDNKDITCLCNVLRLSYRECSCFSPSLLSVHLMWVEFGPRKRKKLMSKDMTLKAVFCAKMTTVGGTFFPLLSIDQKYYCNNCIHDGKYCPSCVSVIKKIIIFACTLVKVFHILAHYLCFNCKLVERTKRDQGDSMHLIYTEE